MTKAQLLALIEATIFQNTAGLINAGQHQDMLKEIIEATFPAPQPGTTTPTWTSTSVVIKGTYWFFDDRVWFAKQASGPGFGGAVEPGSNPIFWQQIELSDLAHPQNTDIRLGRYLELLDGGGTQTFNLTNPLFIDKNYFILQSDAGGSNANYSLKTSDAGTVKRGEFLCIVPGGVGFEITFETDANQDVGSVPLILGAGDWAKFEGDVEGKSLLIASNKITFQTEDIAFTEQSGHPVVTDQVLRITVDGQDYDINVKKL